MDEKLKHLEFIQGVINRLSTNSFLLKGWAVTLMSALFALFVSNPNVNLAILAYFPVIAFWVLDGYFLSLERGYRKLYDEVRCFDKNNINFSMDIDRTHSGWKKWMLAIVSWILAIVSRTLIIFYGILLIAVLLFTCLEKLQ